MNITDNQPVFDHESFGLGEDGQVADQATFCFGLQALIDQPLVAIRGPQLVERVFRTISEADLANWPEAAMVKKLVADVKTHWVKVRLGDSFRHVPRVRLENDCGPKFKQQYMHNLADASKHELGLSLPENATPEHYPPKLTKSFLSHLQTGEVSDEGFDENVLDLLSLALLHTQSPLVEGCVNFLVENLNFDNLDLLFAYGRDQNCHQLKWACLCFMQKNLAKVPKVLQDKYPDHFQLIKSLQDKQITLRLSPSGQTEIHIEYLQRETAVLLEQINQVIPIHSLVMLGRWPRKLLPSLEELARRLQELQELIIHSQDTTDREIPTLKRFFPKLTAFGNRAPFLKTFQEVETYLTHFTKPGAAEPGAKTLTLRSLNLSSIKTLDDSQMAKLTEYLQDVHHLSIESKKITSVIAPSAMEISCRHCTLLTTIKAPKAMHIDCHLCKALTTINAPNATAIDCHQCTAFTTLEIFEITGIKLIKLQVLTTLKLLGTTEVDCHGCPALTTLEAPDAMSINCNGCDALTTLQAPNATTIDCNGCSALTTLEAPNATTIDCSFCYALAALEAPNATSIDCWGCHALTNLKAPKATKIECSSCHALKTVNAPQATKIVCELCTALTILEAPQATTIRCHGCALTTLEAPKATKIECQWCALTSLEAPNATTIDCNGCTALTTLEAPNATALDCSLCSALTTVRAPNATEIHCTDCVMLTTLDAPHAKLFGESRIQIWSRWFWNQIPSSWAQFWSSPYG